MFFTAEWMGQVPGCLAAVVRLLIPVLAVLLVLHFVCGLGGEIFRKLLHGVAFCFPAVLTAKADCWQVPVFLCLCICAVVYPVLAALEGRPWFAGFFVQRAPGEVKSSLLQLFLTAAFMISVLWGHFDAPYLEITSVLMWGFGDAAAGLIGRRFGRRKLKLPFADPHKTAEGSLAMLLVSWTAGSLCLMLFRGSAPFKTVVCALLAAAAGTYAESISKRGLDTVSVPIVIAGVLLLLARI